MPFTLRFVCVKSLQRDVCCCNGCRSSCCPRIPVLQQVEGIMNSLDEDSQFMKASWQVFGPYCQKSRAFERLKGCMLSSQDLRGVLDDTAKISKAVELTSKTMTMLNDMMQSEPNQSPKSSSAQERQHVAGQRERFGLQPQDQHALRCQR